MNLNQRKAWAKSCTMTAKQFKDTGICQKCWNDVGKNDLKRMRGTNIYLCRKCTEKITTNKGKHQ